MEPVPVCLGEIVYLVLARVQAAGRHRVQQRLPQMGPGALDQCYMRPPPPAEPVAQPGDELQARRTPAHHDDPVQCLRRRIGPRTFEPRAGGTPAVLFKIGLTVQHLRHSVHSG